MAPATPSSSKPVHCTDLVDASESCWGGKKTTFLSLKLNSLCQKRSLISSSVVEACSLIQVGPPNSYQDCEPSPKFVGMEDARPFQLLQHGTPIKALRQARESREMSVTHSPMETLMRMSFIARIAFFFGASVDLARSMVGELF